MSRATLVDTLIAECHEPWRAYIEHDFVQQLARGSLPAACFEHYLKQDYLFLIQFARAFGLAAFKSQTLDEIRRAQASLSGIVDVEMDLHVRYCERFGISRSALEATVESTPNMAYTRYVMERGMAGDLLDLNIALAPCILGYAEIARYLQAQPFTVRDANPYIDWIDMYASEDYQEVAEQHRQACNTLDIDRLGPQRLDRLRQTFDAATRLEIDFWQMGLDLR